MTAKRAPLAEHAKRLRAWSTWATTLASEDSILQWEKERENAGLLASALEETAARLEEIEELE